MAVTLPFMVPKHRCTPESLIKICVRQITYPLLVALMYTTYMATLLMNAYANSVIVIFCGTLPFTCKRLVNVLYNQNF